MSRLSDYKKKVHEEFDAWIKVAPYERWRSSDEFSDYIKAFYDNQFDNLLVEVEGLVPVEKKSDWPNSHWSEPEHGWNECRIETLQALTRFKGEEKKV